MISISGLLCAHQSYGDSLRYQHGASQARHGTGGDRGPVVVWNSTQACNLHCLHCYSESGCVKPVNELDTSEAKAFIDDLASFRVPVLLISGGEPFMRPDLLELAAYAISRGIRVTISTNGTLITANTARQMKQIGISYVGISLDGLQDTHDRFRRQKGAFDRALKGIRHCLDVGQKVGLRLTLHQENLHQLDDMFDLLKEEKIPRACFYHLVYSGRGQAIQSLDLTANETRQALDTIMKRTMEAHARGMQQEILTVDNHADNIYLYLKLRERNPAMAEQVLGRMRLSGGNRTGIAIGEVDWHGNVHPDQFTRNHRLGNIRNQPFSEIWTQTDHPILNGLRDRKPLLEGRCASCNWLDVCNGNFRARAEAVSGRFWSSDPACYLTEEEISLRLDAHPPAVAETFRKVEEA
ncbi:radical SAM protein [Marinicrinis sediminis]|uniref:Radical SAM protein n=1 Tax=Marinicrinis sediminis TaxID=1652465 RepID=A0ABW5RDY9_9BACL